MTICFLTPKEFNIHGLLSFLKVRNKSWREIEKYIEKIRKHHLSSFTHIQVQLL